MVLAVPDTGECYRYPGNKRCDGTWNFFHSLIFASCKGNTKAIGRSSGR